MKNKVIVISFVLNCVLGMEILPPDSIWTPSINKYTKMMMNTGGRTDKLSPVKKDEPVLGPFHIKTSTKTYYVQIFGYQLNWFKAMQFCEFQGMELASINSQEEYEALKEALTKNYSMKIHFWTSGIDLGQRNDFVWMATGSQIQVQAWGPNEPNHLLNKPDKEMDCVELTNDYGYDNFSLNDRVCSFQAHVICEK